jgi:hypothetical protein
VTPKNPLGAIRDLALHALKHPRGTAEKAVDQAWGTASLGRLVVGQVGRTAVATAARAVESLVGGGAEADGRDGSHGGVRSTGDSGRTASSPADLRPVPPVNEPAHPSTEPPTAVAVDAPAKQQGDPTAPNPISPARRATAKKSAAKKTPADTAAAAKKTASETSTGKKAAAQDVGAKKAAAKKVPAQKTAKSAPRPTTTAADAGEPATGDQDVDATPADVAKAVAKRTTAKRTTAKTATAKRATAKKATPDEPVNRGAKKATRKTAKKAPAGDDTLVYTSDSGDGPGNADDGGLQQPLIDPATVKAVASKTATSRRASDPDKG